jgi:hypothetical protein
VTIGDGATICIAVCAVVSVVLQLIGLFWINVIHTATNSMKDALVATTAKASEAQGHAAGLEQGRAEHEQNKVA